VPFFSELERRAEEEGEESAVRDWGISHSTLEEVFLHIMREDD
jgi:hypothetical protein